MSNGKTVAIEIELLDRISGGLDRVNKKLDALKGSTAEAKKGLSGLENMSDRVKRSLMGLGMAFSMKGLVSEIANVRGQFQQLEVAFNTMLGSADKADALMAQLVRTAATTPFDLEGVAQGAKQLLAYGMEAEKVNETLIRLGDIAAGLSMPLNDLVYLYGTTMAQGRLYTQDLNQFTGRGIPMIQELAKVFGVAESKVKDLVEAGRVGFPEVQKVIENLTGEGSKFGGLMEEQSKTISGQIRNIKDDIASMFNDMGKQSEGVINTTLSGVTYIVEHYEQFGRVLMGLVATYGTYRTACMTVAAVHSLITVGIGGMTAAEAIHYGWIVMVEKAQKLLNATMLSNQYVLVATAIAGVVAMMISMKTETELIKAADEAYEAQKQKVIEAEEEHKRKMEELCSIAGDEALSTDTRREALNRLEQKYPSIFAKYDTEYEKLRNIKKIKQEIAELEAGQSIAKPKNELGNVNKRIQELEAKQKTERWKMSYGSLHRVGGLSREEEAELKSLQQRQQNLNKQVRKDAVNAYFEDLTGVSNNDLKKQIKERENLMARMKMSGRKYGYTTNDGKNIRGTYTMDELQYQLNKLRSERNRRNEPRRSSSDWGAADKKAYQAALKEYNDFVRNGSNNLTKEEYDKKAKELKEKTELAKKEYDSRKAGTDKDSDRAEKDAAKAEAAEERRKQAKLNQQETNANYLGMAYAQAGYWNKHRSWKHYWKGFTGDQTEWIKQNVKGDFNGSIWSLSPEEMKKLLGNVDIAEYIKNTGKGGYGAKVLDKLQDYAAQAGKLEELTDSWRETVTQISFESMKDSFMSNLMDMKKGSKDFAEGFATDMQKALLSYSMEDLVNGKLKKLYDDWAKTISEKNGELTEKDIEDFNRRYDEIVAEGLKRRDEWAKVTGYEDASGTSQSAKAGGFSAMTQEQGTKLEGMFVSGLQHWSSMDERLETVAERMSVAESHLARIAENTGTSAEHLGEIKEEIRKILRDGLKVK